MTTSPLDLSFRLNHPKNPTIPCPAAAWWTATGIAGRNGVVALLPSGVDKVGPAAEPFCRWLDHRLPQVLLSCRELYERLLFADDEEVGRFTVDERCRVRGAVRYAEGKAYLSVWIATASIPDVVGATWEGHSARVPVLGSTVHTRFGPTDILSVGVRDGRVFLLGLPQAPPMTLTKQHGPGYLVELFGPDVF